MGNMGSFGNSFSFSDLHLLSQRLSVLALVLYDNRARHRLQAACSFTACVHTSTRCAEPGESELL
jgi:hypothetical protein